MSLLLEELVETGVRMGLELREIDLLRAEYNFGFYDSLNTAESKGRTMRDSIDAVSTAETRGYQLGLRYIHKTVDEWHK